MVDEVKMSQNRLRQLRFLVAIIIQPIIIKCTFPEIWYKHGQPAHSYDFDPQVFTILPQTSCLRHQNQYVILTANQPVDKCSAFKDS